MVAVECEEALREELGRQPADVFAWFDSEPLAAASIGQVHAARTRDGDDLVVKIQYPGVADASVRSLESVPAAPGPSGG
jgi:predicted unusual protein kinase regulating ubiquinone biosynthesis (AarF/ABC1/UbiB family)